MANNKVLTIDITNENITIVEVTAAQKKQTYIHDVVIFDTPEDSYEDGFIRDKDKIGTAIREQLNAKGISNKNAIFVLSSSKIVNREVMIPSVPDKKVAGIINANASEYFPVNIEDYVIAHSVLETVAAEDGSKNKRIMVVAAPQQMVRTYYELASVAGLNVQSIDYVGNAMLQLIKTQTADNATTMVVQIGSESTVLNIVRGDTLLLQRTVPYGINAVVAEVMEAKDVDASTALSLLQSERLITVDFDDDAITGSFRYLINNIGRVMDYYSSRNPDKPIDDVYLTGDGALVRGVDGLFKIQLNVATKVMDSLYSVKFDDKINTQIYSPVYLISSIGAAMAPMGFILREQAEKKAGKGATVACVVFLVFAIIGAIGMVVVSFVRLSLAKAAKSVVENQIASIQDIEQIYNDYLDSVAVYNDMLTLYDSTKISNEYMMEFWNTLEEIIPTNVNVLNISSASGGVSISMESTDYDSIARLIKDLRDVDCIQNAFISSVSEAADEVTGARLYTYTVTCSYVLPEYEANLVTTEAPVETTEEPATEAE
ncbi:MAG: pilus assembly protein PilM [Bacteroides sp.]|nr:pilus assembly protein PilM [Bacteroides sp.]MCM1548607.1 pilus assembly protein PilM [Clostridium sp.]